MELFSFFGEKWENEIRYENPILEVRRIQLETLGWNNHPDFIEKVFYSIPKNFRKIFMVEADIIKAKEKCGAEFIKNMKLCLKYCIEVVG